MRTSTRFGLLSKLTDRPNIYLETHLGLEMSYGIRLLVSGKWALFTRPEMKVERFTQTIVATMSLQVFRRRCMRASAQPLENVASFVPDHFLGKFDKARAVIFGPACFDPLLGDAKPVADLAGRQQIVGV